MTINNRPDYANEYEYIVATEYNDELWFWGAYNDIGKAGAAAREVNGIIVFNKGK